MKSDRKQKEYCVLKTLIVVPYHWNASKHNKAMIVTMTIIVVTVVLIHTTDFLECLSNAISLFLELDKNFHWRIADLQCCTSFCCTAKWFSYIYIFFSVSVFHRVVNIIPCAIK